MSPRLIAAPYPDDPHACVYLPGRQASFEHYNFYEYDDDAFCRVLEAGFRHFGDYYFRPRCPGAAGECWCGRCLPIRIPVAQFQVSKSQGRVLRRGREVVMQIGRPRYEDFKYELYLRHKARFQGKSPTGSTEAEDGTLLSADSFHESFYGRCPVTHECIYRLGERTIGVGLLDLASRAASSIYFFFDPADAWLSPGTLSVLCEIEYARVLGIPYYYLGYTIEGNPSMRYKQDFRPCEIFDGQSWRTLRDERGAYQLDSATLRTGRFPRLTSGA